MRATTQWKRYNATEIEDLRATKFSQAQACYILDLSSDRLLTWHKLKLIPEPRRVKGRGMRRAYNFHQLAHIAGMRALASRGVPLAQASKLSEMVLVDIIKNAWEDVCKAESPEKAAEVMQLLVVFSGMQPAIAGAEEKFDSPWLWDFFIEGRSQQSGENLQTWMRSNMNDTVIVLDPGGIAFGLLAQMEVVLAPSGKREVQEYMAEFRPKTRT